MLSRGHLRVGNLISGKQTALSKSVTSRFQCRSFNSSVSLQQSPWSNVEMGPPDAILGITAAFLEDPSEKKINLGVGAYRDDNGKPFVLESVRTAEVRLMEKNLNHEYGPIGGTPEFTQKAAKLLLGNECAPLKEGRVASIQTISGTGALRILSDFLRSFIEPKEIYLPSPTWGNHGPVFKSGNNFIPKSYSYYNPSLGQKLDFEGMVGDIDSLSNGSFLLLQSCAHNPTGIDPTPAQWDELSQLCKKKQHTILFDSAYQGFASGNPENDTYSVRKFIDDGHFVVIAQSFAKNFGLYGHRVGAAHIICNDPDERARVMSQLLIKVRPMYSNPPIHGPRIVNEILGDEDLTSQWRKDVKTMADRIISMRTQLKQHLIDLGSPHNWDHITSQIGMFCYSGLTPEQVDKMRDDWHVYMTRDGRISMAGVSSGTVAYLAEAIHNVTK